MAKHQIAVIKGDGIGVDVVDEALKVLEALAGKHGIEWEFVEFPWSSEYYFEHGEMMPSDGVERLTWLRCDIPWCGRASGGAGPHHAERVAAADTSGV